MSVVIKRDHPSGEFGISAAAFPEDKTVVVGVGPLRDMRYIALSVSEAMDVEDAIGDAVDSINGVRIRN